MYLNHVQIFNQAALETVAQPGFWLQWLPCIFNSNVHILVFSWFKNGSSYNGHADITGGTTEAS